MKVMRMPGRAALPCSSKVNKQTRKQTHTLEFSFFLLFLSPLCYCGERPYLLLVARSCLFCLCWHTHIYHWQWTLNRPLHTQTHMWSLTHRLHAYSNGAIRAAINGGKPLLWATYCQLFRWQWQHGSLEGTQCSRGPCRTEAQRCLLRIAAYWEKICKNMPSPPLLVWKSVYSK